MRKRILILLLVVVAALIVYNWSLIVYAAGQGMGQLKIIREAKPVDQFLADPDFPDSLKERLRLIEAARKYAIDSLSLHDTENYTTLYDQKGEEIMWVVIACEPFRLEAKRWDFPVIGSVPYKGFFNKEKAFKERDGLVREGWDVSIRNPSGWSTLGWFTDPILSGMLRRSEGDLASLIIHEMVHATIYVKDSSDFNENLASFIGDRGAELFLKQRYGDSSRQYQEYIHQDSDYRKVADHMLRGTRKLDSLYQTMTDKEPVEGKRSKKEACIRSIVEAFDTITFSDGKRRRSRFARQLPNNTYFMSFRTYESKHDAMLDDWNHRFRNNLRAMIDYYRANHPSL